MPNIAVLTCSSQCWGYLGATTEAGITTSSGRFYEPSECCDGEPVCNRGVFRDGSSRLIFARRDVFAAFMFAQERALMDMSTEDMLRACGDFKHKGNLFHQEGQYRRAALQYRQVLLHSSTTKQ